MAKIEIELSDLEAMLREQKRICSEYIARNLSVYEWSNREIKYKSDKTITELQQQAIRAPYPNDFNVLNKYVKQCGGLIVHNGS